MKSKLIYDSTIKDIENDNRISFREKLETVKMLDHLGVDVVMLPSAMSEHAQILISSIVPFIKKSRIAVDVCLGTKCIDRAIEALEKSKNCILNVCVPCSEIEMEYSSGIKLKNLKEKLNNALDYINEKSIKAMITCKDLIRSEEKILKIIAEVVSQANIDAICFEEKMGQLQNEDMTKFLDKNVKLFSDCKNTKFIVDFSDKYKLALSNCLFALNHGFSGVVTSIQSNDRCGLVNLVDYVSECGKSAGIEINITKDTLISFSDELAWVNNISKTNNLQTQVPKKTGSIDDEIQLEQDADADLVLETIKNLGYEIEQEDNQKIYQEFKRISDKKTVGTKEIDAIVATTANQIPQTYKLVDFVINTSNLFVTTASVSIDYKGKVQNTISKGNGPLDAAFKAISMIVGYDYKLEDFQIQNLTKSIEAVGMAIIKLTYKGHSYSGKGVSTDIVSAGIRAYINAINALIYKGQKN